MAYGTSLLSATRVECSIANICSDSNGEWQKCEHPFKSYVENATYHNTDGTSVVSAEQVEC